MRMGRMVNLVSLVMMSLVFVSFSEGSLASEMKNKAQGQELVDSVVFAKNGLYIGGQPSRDDLVTLKNQGVRRVINLRTTEEDQGIFDQEKQWAKDLGLEFVHLSVSGEDISSEKSRKLAALLDQSTFTLLHCASGNRVGALMAINHYQKGGVSIDEALAYGEARGLRSLKSRVKSILKAIGKDAER